MPNLNQPSSLRPPVQGSGTPLHGTLKGALALLVLMLLMLLFWQLFDQFQRTQTDQRQHSIDSSADLADHVNLNMALNAQIVLNQLLTTQPFPSARERAETVTRIRRSVPELQSLAWLSGDARIIADTLLEANDDAFITALVSRLDGDSHYYTNSTAADLVYLLIRQPGENTNGYWLLRMSPIVISRLIHQVERGQNPSWVLENHADKHVIGRADLAPFSATELSSAELNQSVLVTQLSHSDWQLRSLFNARQARLALLPPLVGKCLLGLLISLVPLLALLSMRRRQRELNEERRRYRDIFEGAGVALCVLDLSGVLPLFERVGLNERTDLGRWLEDNPATCQELLQALRITEVNHVALRVLQVHTNDQAWRKLIEGWSDRATGIGHQLIGALLQRQQQLELEIRLDNQQGHDQYLWVTVRFPEHAKDYHAVILSITDVTSHRTASESLRQSEKRHRMLAESISDVIFSTNNRMELNYVSPSVQTVLGFDADWVMQNGWQGMLANPAQLTGINALLTQVHQALHAPAELAALRSDLKTQVFMFDCLRNDGRKIPIELRLVLIWDTQGTFEGILGVGRDVSQQRRAEKDLRMAATVFEHSTSAILITDPAGYIVQANEAFSRVSGYAVAQVLDQLPNMLTVDDQQEAHLRYVLKQLQQRGTWEGEVWLKRRNGEHYPAWVGITAVLDDEGDLASYVCFFSDISERKASEQRIHRLAYYDALTHLPNRTLFQDRLYNALQQAERQQSWVVLMFLDLDRFKPINDSLGHAAGDRMLKDMATRLLGCVDDDDTVARMGGDEFTLLLQPRATRELALNQAIHVAEQILGSLVKPFVLEGREFFVTASVGIALSPQDGGELSQLMKNADTAMYHAKERGKNNFQFYQADMNATALERLELESDLRHALEQQEFVLYYQPQFSGDGKRLTGAEALLRWNHPRRGLVPPVEFIPVLEELGLVVDVGDWVLAEACRQLKAWHLAKVRVPKISVNISARQFADGQLGNRIARMLEITGLPPACLELELTESILMREVNEAMMILDTLKNLGLSIAVDDFGTGYSSLNYLKQFPIDVLKIDRTFVDGLPSGEQDAQIARAIIAMAHSLNLSVIAEGVETHEQLEFLREHGCDEVQGYLFGRPMQAHRFETQFSNDALFLLQ
ncbi:PAS domain S-box-containing protein/diguanylate cyclase (GGDEF) domain-containing protein [Pseudomonas coleopterorum]|nr:PAS domain S-box-containing protein/diguanylate cyclase (GGDEF) domain-containing protein [Pseudomonas coleopterorum]